MSTDVSQTGHHEMRAHGRGGRSIDPLANGTDPSDLQAHAQGPWRGGGRTGRSVALALAPVAGVVGFLLLWQALVRGMDIPRYELPAPWDILRHLASDPGYYWTNGRRTAWEAFLGFLLAFGVGVGGGALMAQSRFVDRAMQPLAVLVQVTPIIAYAPAIVIWLGFGLKPVLFLASLVCVVPFLLNAVTGLRAVDPSVLELARSVDASRSEVFWRLRVPSALPYLFTAARISVGLALIGAVLGEFFAGVTKGLGFSVKLAQSRNLPLQLWGSVFVLALVGSLATVAIGVLERVLLRWHASQHH
jgi:NitT/TauT family transport system permease protein